MPSSEEGGTDISVFLSGIKDSCLHMPKDLRLWQRNVRVMDIGNRLREGRKKQWDMI